MLDKMHPGGKIIEGVNLKNRIQFLSLMHLFNDIEFMGLPSFFFPAEFETSLD